MTDKEITKALDDLIHLGDAPIGKDYGVIVDKQTLKEALDLINHLKAEIEESREKNAGLALALLHEVVNEDEQLKNEIVKVAKSEARKEFVAKAEKRAVDAHAALGVEIVFTVDDLYDLLKEMGCE